MTWFGPWFPLQWFGPWFPGYAAQTLFLGFGPGGAATFATDLESDFKVTLDWSTDIIKSYSGREKRAAVRNAPKQRFNGQTMLLGEEPADIRAKLGSLMALGQPFLLGLQYEGLTLVEDSAGSLVFVSPAMVPWCDWLMIGQYAIVKNDDVFKLVVIQDIDTVSGTVTVDAAPGSAGVRNAEIMPALGVFFEPQQNFERYPVNVEVWDIAARNAVFDFAPPRAEIDLGTINPTWAGGRIVARPSGLAGNLITFELDPFVSNPVGGALAETIPTNTTAQMKGDTDTLADLATLLNTQSGLLKLIGTYDGSVVIGSGDGFTATLAGGDASGLAGSGAVLTTYAGNPVWDWPIVVSTSAQDSIQSMVSVFDFGGVPVVVATADDPDYGRALTIRSTRRQDWQWLKKFLWSILGSQKAFWLPTWREDLMYVSGAGVSIVVSGNVVAWYPRQHDRLMFIQAGGVVTYTQILGTVPNADGTTQLTLADPVDNILMISWLELCRFESSSFDIVWKGAQFEVSSTARVVQQ